MKLSQAMIVKNEESNIERALSWGKGIVSEQIVIDTGSTDNTVKIAESMGAKVYHFEWIDDFSAAKNYAIEKCSGDWIAFLDADEYFMKDADKILSTIKKAEREGAYVIAEQLLDLNDKGKIIGSMTQARLFKNHEGIEYQKRIHEHLCSKKPVKIYDATKELSIFHTGYSDSEQSKKNKSEKYKILLEKEIMDRPEDADMYGYLGDIYAGQQDYIKAEELYNTALKYMDKANSIESGRRGTTLRNLLVILGGYNYRTDELLQVYEFACRILPQDADFSAIVADHFYRYQNYEKAAVFFKHSLDSYNKFGAFLKSDYVDSHLVEIHTKFSNAYFMSEQPIEAIKIAVKILSSDKYNVESLRILLLSVQEAEKKGNIGYSQNEEYKLLERLYDLDSLKDKAFIYVTAKKLGVIGLSDIIKSHCSMEEAGLIDKMDV